MKTILIATDFSTPAKNAANYVMELFKGKECRILLYHSYHIPLPVAHEPILVNFEDLEGESLASLEKEKERLKERSGLNIECYTQAGFAVDNLIEAENEYHPDLIVMGMAGAGALSEFLLGSITTSFVQRTATPVLVVPEGAAFKPLSKIAFACDYDFDPTGDVLAGLKKFVSYFNLKLLIMNLLDRQDVLDSEKAANGVMVDNYFRDVDHTYFFMEDEEFVEGVKKFVRDHDADLIAMIPHKHSLLSNLFRESHTKKLAFHTSLPLLVLPERIKAK